MRRKLLPWLSLLLLANVIVLRAQEEDVADTTLFRQAVESYVAGRFGEALPLFNRLVREYPESERITATLIMRGKTLLAVGENLEAARAMRSFLEQYPQSRYIADAHLVLAGAYQAASRNEEAHDELMAAWHTMPLPQVPSLVQAIVAGLDSLAGGHMSLSEIQRSLARTNNASLRAYFWLRIGEDAASRENSNGVAEALDTLSLRYPGNPFGGRIAGLRTGMERVSNLKVAIVLPVMKEGEPSLAREIARDVGDGIQVALDEYRRNPSSRIAIAAEVHDTGRDPKLAAQIVRTVAADPSCVAVLGPVFSATATTAAVAAQTAGIPLISPTANANGIAAAGPFVFQANADYENRGRAMARYAVVARGYRRLATLAPSDSYGKFLAEAFAREALRLGARVLAQEWYVSGASDLQPHFAAIRRAGMVEEAEPLVSFSGKFGPSERMRLMDLGIPRKRIDSLLTKSARVRAVELLGPRAKILMDSLGLTPSFDLSRLDSVEYPVSGIEAVYIPVSASSEIGVVSSQFVYFNLKAQLLGSGEWNDLPELHEHRRYTTGVLFESDNFIDSASAPYQDFVARFHERFGRMPSRHALYGYDTGSLVFALIRNGAATRSALARMLALMKEYQGLHSKIGFSPSRANMWLEILRFNGEDLDRLEEMRVD